MSLKKLCEDYWDSTTDENDLEKLYGSKCPTNTLQEFALAWGFNKACEMMGKNPQVLLQQEKSAEEEEEFDL